jgi:hypothetical protein
VVRLRGPPDGRGNNAVAANDGVRRLKRKRPEGVLQAVVNPPVRPVTAAIPGLSNDCLQHRQAVGRTAYLIRVKSAEALALAEELTQLA